MNSAKFPIFFDLDKSILELEDFSGREEEWSILCSLRVLYTAWKAMNGLMVSAKYVHDSLIFNKTVNIGHIFYLSGW